MPAVKKRFIFRVVVGCWNGIEEIKQIAIPADNKIDAIVKFNEAMGPGHKYSPEIEELSYAEWRESTYTVD